MTAISNLRWGLLIATALLAGTTESQAEGLHQFNIINNSEYTLRITNTQIRCIEDGTTVNWPSTIAPGQAYTVQWEDSNSFIAYDGYFGCDKKDKFVAFSFSLDNAQSQYDGYLGITHRELSGSSWYNGQFYAASVQVGPYGNINGSDGAVPPDWVEAICSHGNNCFGPWSEMEMDEKDSYNWQRSYQTEDGWAFQISSP